MHSVTSCLPCRTPRVLLALTGFLFALLLSAFAADDGAKRTFDVPAGNADRTLRLFSEQSGRGVIFAATGVKDVQTNAVKGELTPGEAVERLTKDTPLVVTKDEKTGAFAVRKETPAEAKNGSSRPGSDRAADGSKVEGGVIKLDTFEVMATKLLNMDIPRTRDDAQPYVILGRTAIEESGAVDLESFLKQRLTMNTTSQSRGQSQSFLGNMSSINLRGLGSNQTLILVDGHRFGSGTTLGGLPIQPDLNGIPLSAIERIEVLATTASGIYGGTATGGVVNVILRRNYAGVEFRTTYTNAFDTDAANRRFDLSAAYTSRSGKTNLIFAASWNDQNILAAGDREFIAERRQRLFTNNPASYLNAINPPLSLTPNIRSSDNSNLVLKTGQALGSNITFVPTGYTGIVTDGGAALIGNAGKYNLVMNTSAATAGTQYVGSAAAVVSSPRVASASFTARTQLTTTLQAFFDAGASENLGRFTTVTQGFFYTIPTSSSANPFNQNIVVSVPSNSLDTNYTSKSQNFRLTTGIIAQLGGDWKAEADYAWVGYRLRYSSASAILAAAATAVNNGSLIVLRDTNLFPVDFSPFKNPMGGGSQDVGQDDFTLRASGPIGSLPGGRPTLSTMVEHLRLNYSGSSTFAFGSASTFATYSLPTSQTVLSAYAELKLPLVSSINRATGIEELELQLAGRFDDYDIRGGTGSITVGSTTPEVRSKNNTRSSNPTLALRYKPLPDLMFRASYGTGFVPPAVNQLTLDAPLATTGGTNDPRRGNQVLGSYQRIGGGNPSLRPEQSKSWSAGLVYTPKQRPDFRFSLDWTKISKTDNIVTLSIPQVVANESIFPDRVTRGANLPGDQPGWAGPITVLDLSAVNIARAEVEAYDAQLDYQLRTQKWGNVAFFAIATYQPHYKTQLLPTTPMNENVGVTILNPLKVKGNLGITWTNKAWTLGWVGRYFDSYLAADPTLSTSATTFLNQGGTTVSSQSYHDVFAKYRFGGASRLNSWKGLLARTELQLGVRNIFNKAPPFDASNSSYLYSVYGEPQLATYYLSLRKQF